MLLLQKTNSLYKWITIISYFISYKWDLQHQAKTNHSRYNKPFLKCLISSNCRTIHLFHHTSVFFLHLKIGIWYARHVTTVLSFFIKLAVKQAMQLFVNLAWIVLNRFQTVRACTESNISIQQELCCKKQCVPLCGMKTVTIRVQLNRLNCTTWNYCHYDM